MYSLTFWEEHEVQALEYIFAINKDEKPETSYKFAILHDETFCDTRVT
jgi:hypothetical protein